MIFNSRIVESYISMPLRIYCTIPYPFDATRNKIPQRLDHLSDFLNKLLVKLQTSFLNQMCSRHCRCSEKSLKTRRQRRSIGLVVWRIIVHRVFNQLKNIWG